MDLTNAKAVASKAIGPVMFLIAAGITGFFFGGFPPMAANISFSMGAAVALCGLGGAILTFRSKK
ncbi:MAG: hypothetical protein WCK91_03335 [bacterium]